MTTLPTTLYALADGAIGELASNIAGAVLAPVGGLPTTNGSWPAIVRGVVSAGASPSGTLRIQHDTRSGAGRDDSYGRGRGYR